MSRLLLTGATGFLGGELLVRLVERTDRDIITLVRADDQEAAQARLDATLAQLLPPEAVTPGRVRAVAAHLDRPGLGLAERERDALAAEIDTVVHCAASVQFTLPYDEAHAINVGGTRGDARPRGARAGRWSASSTSRPPTSPATGPGRIARARATSARRRATPTSRRS